MSKMKKRLIFVQLIVVFISVLILFNISSNLSVNASSGINDGNPAYIYASDALKNMIKTNGAHTIEYKSDTDTVRVTAAEAHGDPQILINFGENVIGSPSGAWANEYGDLVISYRASKSTTRGRIYIKYKDSLGGVQDYQGYAAHTEEIKAVPTNQLNAANTNFEKNFYQMTFNLSAIPACQHNPVQNAHGHGWRYATTVLEIRIDYLDSCEAGDWFEIDAIAFCKKDNDYSGSLKTYPSELKKDYFIWERENVRNNHGRFEASTDMSYLFYDSHMVNVRYDSAVDAIELKIVNNECQHIGDHVIRDKNGNIIYNCSWHNTKDPPGVFDPTIAFRMPDGIAKEYSYMILTYMTPSDVNSEIIYHKDPSGVKVEDSFEERNYSIPVGIYPKTSKGTQIEKYRRDYPIYETGVWYTRYVNLADDNQQDVMTEVRIDPFNLAYVQENAVLYIKSIIFLKEVDTSILVDKFPYNYLVSYDPNAGADNSLVTNMPEIEDIVHGGSNLTSYTFRLPDIKPERPNYTFVGWAETPDGAPMLSVTEYTVQGKLNELVKKNLYAVWSENSVTIKYELSPPKEGLSGYASLSVTSQKVEVLADSPAGTTLTLTPGYKLEGWYDEGGTKVSTSLTFVPTKQTYAWSERTFTAKIIYETIQIGVSVLDGKNYSSLGTSATSVNIVQNSALTIELSLSNYYPNVHEDLQIMNMTKTFPEYTKLLLIDITDSSKPKYYYYETKVTDKGIRLTDFVSALDNTTNYSDNYEAVRLTKKYLIIADFRTVTLDTGTYKIECVNNPLTTEGTIPTITINVGTNRSFEFNDTSASELTMNEKLNVSYNLTTNVGTGSDELYDSRSLALVVELKDETNNKILFPEGAYITYNGSEYYPTLNGDVIIISLGSISNKTINLSLNTPYQKLNEASYSLSVTSYVSATSAGDKPMGGEKLTTINTTFNVVYGNKAVSIEVNDSDSLFTKEEAESGISVNVKHTSNINKNNILIYVEKLENGSWVEVSNVLKGTVNITDTFSIQLDSTKLSGMTTYRIVIKTSDNLVQDEALFIITE